MDVFSTEGVLRAAWEKFKGHFFYVWTLFAVYIALIVFFSLLGDRFEDGPLGILVVVSSAVLGTIVQLGLIKGLLDLVATNTEKGIEVLFSQYKLFFRYFVANVLFQIIVVIGLVLLVVPGIYFMLRFQFFSYLMVDKNLGIMDAFKKSSEMTEGIKWKLLGFGLVLLFMNILGALVFLVGLAVTLPVSALAYVMVYYALLNQAKAPVATETPVPATSPEVPPVPGSTV